ncbi:hypothetical protein GCM10017620_18210 [Brevundimonas intermedia]|uniref:Uncharacterized protein n=1 Tax=Brevundimonas intermedia TaxID=74315 RepID=A0ABQ5T930_9CAUL|nr:hypothetical protein GCM10017620_18210 [Brevundimonas intermedia]
MSLDRRAVGEPDRAVAEGEDGAGVVEQGGGDLGVEIEVHGGGVSGLRGRGQIAGLFSLSFMGRDDRAAIRVGP